jgi:hypothetical protein
MKGVQMGNEVSKVVAGERGLEIRSFSDAKDFATMVCSSGLAPKGMDTPEKVMVAVQTGMELGLTPMRALQSVVVVNGRASLMGEAALALIRSSGLCEGLEVGFVECDDKTESYGYCRSKRRGDAEWHETRFTWKEAQAAGLTDPKYRDGKPISDSPWRRYPKRMCSWRAVAFHSRDYWSDVLFGIPMAEEMIAIEQERRPAPRPELPPKADPLLQVLVNKHAETIEPDEVLDPQEVHVVTPTESPLTDFMDGTTEMSLVGTEEIIDICPQCNVREVDLRYQSVCDVCANSEE